MVGEKPGWDNVVVLRHSSIPLSVREAQRLYSLLRRAAPVISIISDRLDDG